MQLNVARVCLNCEEVHDGQQCPVCASTTYAFLTRWVPHVVEPRPAKPAPIVRPTRVQRILFGGGVISLVAFGVMRWSRRARRQVDVVAFRNVGELR